MLGFMRSQNIACHDNHWRGLEITFYPLLLTDVLVTFLKVPS
jgi:hypothetical protein